MGEFIGARIKRREDPRLLKGRGMYVADIHLPGMLHCAVLRSPHAHARISRIDTSAAKTCPGVVDVLTYDDLDGIGHLHLHVPSPFLDAEMPYPLARDEVVHVGQPVALVVAESRYIAEDAADLIDIEYAELEAVVDARRAIEEDAPPVHTHRTSNLAAHVRQSIGDVDRAFTEADRIVELDLSLGRVSGQPLETRGIVAVYDAGRDRDSLQVWSTTQVPHTMRHILCAMLTLPTERVRVVTPDVGGGFGTKEIFYPEDVLIPFVAMRLGRPIKWVEDRVESFSGAIQERQQHHTARMALASDGRILGVQVRFINDNGAFSPWGIVVPMITAQTIPGPYHVPNYRFDMYCVYTNKTSLAPYRGAGRPQGTYVMERLLDTAAHDLGLDPAEIRFRNLIQPDEFPYNVGLPGRDGKPLTYDSGDYPGTLRQALDMLGYEQARAEQREARENGRYVGIGIGCCVEYAGAGPFESASVTVESDGTVMVATGLSSQGQGHYTVMAQLCAERLGVPMEKVQVREGDTSLLPYGMGTFASRGAVMGGNAVSAAALSVRTKALDLVSNLLEVSPEDLVIEEGIVHVKGAPEKAYSLGELAKVMDTLTPGVPMPGRLDPGLSAVEYHHSGGLTYANGTHIVVVEVDVATGEVSILRYIALHDCGTMVNPFILDGQMQGGVAQGIGNALYEKIVYADNGQLLTASYMDYLIPTTTEIPAVEVGHRETPSPFNPEGIKGSGEGGTIPSLAAIAAAVDDALAPFGVRTNQIPITPDYVLGLIQAGTAKQTQIESRLEGVHEP